MTDVGTIVQPFLEALDTAIGGRYSAVLHGSAARGTWIPGVSDVNLLLVLDDASPATLRTLADAFHTWRRANQPPPLLLTQEEWRRSADVFALEIADMKAAYKMLRGPDVVAGVTVHRRDLRRALEREFRGKLLQLRRGYLALAGDTAALGLLGQTSSTTILVLLRGLLTLLGEPVPAADGDAVDGVASHVGFVATQVRTFSDHRAEKKLRVTQEQFEHYLAAVEKTAQFVDQLQLENIA